MTSYRSGKAIINERLKTASVADIADCLNVHPAHIYNIDERGISPTLHEALIDAGWIEAPPEVYTLAFRFRDRDQFERVRAVVDEHEDGRTAWLLEQVGE